MIFIDDLNRSVELEIAPQRIVSLVPSITELLFDLGLSRQIIGRTNFCIHPKTKVDKVKKVGGTKDFCLNKIRDLQPNLIIAVKEENSKELVNEISQEFPTIVFDVVDINSAIDMIYKVGEITGKQQQSTKLIANIKTRISNLKSKKIETHTACYLIWNSPMMSINKNTYISEMMNIAGFENVFSNSANNYPIISEKDLESKVPEYILLSSEPFPFKETHKQKYQEQYPNSKIVLVDGEIFSWYGSRMIKALDYFYEKIESVKNKK